MKICPNSNNAAQKDNEMLQKVKLDVKQCLDIRYTIQICILENLSNFVYSTDQIKNDKIMKICPNSNNAAQKDNEILQKVKLDLKQCLDIRSTIETYCLKIIKFRVFCRPD